MSPLNMLLLASYTVAPSFLLVSEAVLDERANGFILHHDNVLCHFAFSPEISIQ